jgi:hypothetical protein
MFKEIVLGMVMLGLLYGAIAIFPHVLFVVSFTLMVLTMAYAVGYLILEELRGR